MLLWLYTPAPGTHFIFWHSNLRSPEWVSATGTPYPTSDNKNQNKIFPRINTTEEECLEDLAFPSCPFVTVKCIVLCMEMPCPLIWHSTECGSLLPCWNVCLLLLPSPHQHGWQRAECVIKIPFPCCSHSDVVSRACIAGDVRGANNRIMIISECDARGWRKWHEIILPDDKGTRTTAEERVHTASSKYTR